MIGIDENVCDEKSIKRFLEQYELPLKVRKNTWFGPFYFKVERVDAMGKAIGKRYRGSYCYDDYDCSIHEIFCLYGENQKKIHQGNVATAVELIQKSDNPNNLDLDMSHYIKGITTLFVHRDNQLFPVIFDRFEEKNGKTVIYVVCNGKRSFYAFPSSAYLFPNKDDGNIAIAKTYRKDKVTHTSLQVAATSKITAAYMKLPKSRHPSQKYEEEIAYEKEYHGFVNEKLLNDLIEPKMSIESSQNDLRQASDDYRQACIDAKENGGVWDDHAYLSTQIRSDSAQRIIQSASSKIQRIEVLRSKPYFARVDCGPTLDKLHTAYLGEQDIAGYVTSWRHPEIGNAYYHSAILQSRDDIVIALKRVIEIENANFISFEDEVNQFFSSPGTHKEKTQATADDFLTRLLKLSREDKSTHDIIRTIQSEQYDIITSDFSQNAVINGCAGSGKTMIMYHRLSYIAYNYETFTHEKFHPESVYVISPSVYFDLSNNSLLEKLSIASVNHAPLVKTAEKLIRKYCVERNIATLYCLSSTDGENINSTDKFFCSETFDSFAAEVEKIQADPNRKLSYESWVIDHINQLLTKVGLPALKEKFCAYQNGKKSLMLYTEDYYYNSCFDKKDDGSKTSRDRNNRKARLKKTIASISVENIQESLDYQKRKLKDKKLKDRILRLDNYLKSSLCSMSLATVPKNDSSGHIVTDLDGDGFWDLFDRPSDFVRMLTLILVEKILNSVFSSVHSEKDYLLKCEYVGEQLISTEHRKNGDYLLYYLAALTRKYGAIIKGRSFVFIDEFQNYSPFEVSCIRNAFEKPAINLYGDFDQRIEEKGRTLQTELQSLIAPTYYNININYRNARQITNYINQAVHKNMHSIGVDGCISEQTLQECSFQINNRTAIIARDTYLAKKALNNKAIELLNDPVVSGEMKEGKISLVSVLDCKGLEFDTVYVLDYGMSENEKYVAYTRALDNLIVIHDDLTSVSCTKASKDIELLEQPPKQYIAETECEYLTAERVPEKESTPTDVLNEKKQESAEITDKSQETIYTVGDLQDNCGDSIEDSLTEEFVDQNGLVDVLAAQTFVSEEIAPKAQRVEKETPSDSNDVKEEGFFVTAQKDCETASAIVNGGNHVLDDCVPGDSCLTLLQQETALSDSEKNRIEAVFKDSVYYDAIAKYSSTDLRELEYALHLLESIGEWREASAKALAFKSKIGLIKLEMEKGERQMAEYRSHNVCQYCGGSFRGILTKSCTKCGRKKDY